MNSRIPSVWHAPGSRVLLVLLFISSCCQRLASQELANTDRDSFQIIQAAEESWRLHKLRDPARIAWLVNTVKKPDRKGYRYREGGRSGGTRRVAQSLLATYYDSYELSDFRVTFLSPAEAVLTYKAVWTGTCWGKKTHSSDYVQYKLEKAGGIWVVQDVLYLPAR